MSVDNIQDRKLVELYHRYIGEPESKRDVYGYWLLLLGSVTGLLGVVFYQAQQGLFPANFGLREAAIVLSAFGLSLGLFAIVVLLPVRRRGMQASILGLAIALLGIIAFTQAYPYAWSVGPDYSPEIIAVYTIGIGIIVGVAILVPIITGEKGLLVEPELGLGGDDTPILVGDTTRDAFFTVYETPTNDWTWRTIQRDALGQSATTVASDTDARMQVESVREKIKDAGLLDITTAAFRLYQTDTGHWEWSLVTEDGSIIARGDDPYDDRDEIESAVSFLKEETPDAGLVEIHGAAFDIYQDDGDRWHWRLIDDQHQPLATGADTFTDEAAAEDSIDRFIDWVDDPRVLALETIGLELIEAEDGWRWRIIDAHDNHLATSDTTFNARGDAETAATAIADELSDASTIEHGTPGYEVHETTDETDTNGTHEVSAADAASWTWRLRDSADDIIATQHGHAPTKAAATASAERTRTVVDDADIIEFEGADYEVYPADDAWHWRLVSADRDVLAESTTQFDDSETAEAEADRVREQALVADLIEFERAAFQQYESDGEWRWRLIDEDGQVMADSGESYEDKSAVREGMQTLKEHAPDAEVLEIDTAAFEIHLTDDGDYAWRLVDETGELIAESATSYPSRTDARDAVDFLSGHIDDATVRAMERATFQLVNDEETWTFWLIDTDGTRLADAVENYPTYDDVTGAISDVQEAGTDAAIDTMHAVTIQLRQNGGYHWRLIDRTRTLIAQGERTYTDQTTAETDIDRLIDNAATAPIFDIGRGVIWLDRTTDDWQWQLIDAERTELAVSPHTYKSQTAAMDDIEMVQARAADADTIDIETLAFEPYRDEESDPDTASAGPWRWRLIDDTETVRAVSAGNYENRETVADAIDDIRAKTRKASILEIDEAAFEFAERDDGWIWRLIDENGAPIAESVTPHDSRQAAREEMITLKEHAPDGETVVTW